MFSQLENMVEELIYIEKRLDNLKRENRELQRKISNREQIKQELRCNYNLTNGARGNHLFNEGWIEGYITAMARLDGGHKNHNLSHYLNSYNNELCKKFIKVPKEFTKVSKDKLKREE